MNEIEKGFFLHSKEKNGMKEMLHYRLNVKGYVKQKTCAVEQRGTNREREREKKKKRELVVFVRVAEIQSDGLISLLPATSSSQ